MKKVFGAISVLFCLVGFSMAQSDSIYTLPFQDYMQRVKTHHPVAYIADIQAEKGTNELLTVRGMFDPMLFHNMEQKYLDDKTYYQLQKSGLKIPTWFGLNIEGGYSQNMGPYINPKDYMPSGGLWYAGVSLPLLQGMFMDKRRAQLKQAMYYRSAALAKRTQILNDLLLEAGETYWEWFESYQQVEIYKEALDVAQVRFNAVKESALLGDRPSIDTLEAGIHVQQRKLRWKEAQLRYRNARAVLEVYLWEQGSIPLELSNRVTPNSMGETVVSGVDKSIVNMQDTILANHPEIQQTTYKMKSLEVKEKLNLEQLKPKLDLKYNAINEPVGGDLLADYNMGNYTWGIDFNVPLFLRKERGELKVTRLEKEETQLQLDFKRTSIQAKSRQAINTWAITHEQHQIYSQTVEDYGNLLNGERTMFAAGESSLFMVNRRELGYIQAKLKLATLIAKNRVAALKTYHTFGVLSARI